MGLGVGIVGLPNVGKSTTFNALTKAQNAEAQNYPFCTIEPNKAIVPVPDKRLDELAKIVNPDKIQHSTIDFVDIAGVVRGASKCGPTCGMSMGRFRQKLFFCFKRNGWICSPIPRSSPRSKRAMPMSTF